MPTPAAKVLICDQADGFRQRLEDMLRDAGLEVVTCGSWDEVAGVAEREHPDAILADMVTPTFDVDELVAVRNAAPDALLAVVSSRHREDGASVPEGTGGIDLVLSKREPVPAIVAALLDRI